MALGLLDFQQRGVLAFTINKKIVSRCLLIVTLNALFIRLKIHETFKDMMKKKRLNSTKKGKRNQESNSICQKSSAMIYVSTLHKEKKGEKVHNSRKD